MAKKWYVVHTQTGKESRVKINLENKIKTAGAEDLISQVLVPTETVSEIRAGKKTISERKFFPGYVLVEMEMTDQGWYLVKTTEGVARFIGSGNNPLPLTDEEVAFVLQQIEEKKEKPKPKVMFEKGENVKVIDGPFTNFNGIIEEVNLNKQRLKVTVSIFGRSTPIDLEYWQVEKT